MSYSLTAWSLSSLLLLFTVVEQQSPPISRYHSRHFHPTSHPLNIITQPRIHISAPMEVIRHALVQHANPVLSTNSTSPIDTTLPEHIESLIYCLRSLAPNAIAIHQVRSTHPSQPRRFMLSIRYGHDVLHDCTYCSTASDFALFALPYPLLQYLRTAVPVGPLTLKISHKQRWYIPVIGVLAAAAAGEAWWISTVPITVNKDQNGVMVRVSMPFVPRYSICKCSGTTRSGHSFPRPPTSPPRLLFNISCNLKPTQSRASGRGVYLGGSWCTTRRRCIRGGNLRARKREPRWQ
jgi:hypothetical protein